MSRICARLNKTRAAYYKHLKVSSGNLLQEELLGELTREKRKSMPRLGGKKTYLEIKEELNALGIRLGRDKYFNWLRRANLLIKPKRRYTKTTQSLHRFRKHQNLIKGLDISHPDQLWVSDITYLRLAKGFCYLALITDVYSRKVIGYDVRDTLELEGALNALKMALKRKRANKQTIHHSDRGIQYCSDKYTQKLQAHQIQISMGEAGNCYENALAERVNGILKSEFNLDATFQDLAKAQKSVHQAIHAYNSLRPHMAIQMRKPNELYAA